MLGWLRRRFTTPRWDLSTLSPPWEADRPAIAAFIEDHVDEDGEGLPDSGMPLPDDDAGADGIRWAAGAKDGVVLFHTATAHDPEAARTLCGLVRAVLADDGLEALPALYAAMLEHSALSWIDDLGPAVVQEPAPDPNRLYALGLLLATQAPDREPVKAGIAMLALLGLSDDDLALLRLLACHDELALFAGVAIASQADEPALELWSIARRTTGWGRVHAVTRLTDPDDGPLSDEIRDWLLREGFQNDVMDQYLAVPVATAGDLAAALDERPVDPELLAAATELIGLLLSGIDPSGSMVDYPDGALATERWMARLAELPGLPLDAVAVLAAVRSAAGDEEGPWTPDASAALDHTARRLLADPTLPERVTAALGDDDRQQDATAAADVLGIDTLPSALDRLDRSPERLHGALVAAGSDPARVARVLARRATLGPLALRSDAVPQDDDPEARSLNLMLQALAVVTGPDAPVAAADWLRLALDSPQPGHRILALRALVAWSQAAWPAGVHERVARLAADGTDGDVQSAAIAAWGSVAEA